MCAKDETAGRCLEVFREPPTPPPSPPCLNTTFGYNSILVAPALRDHLLFPLATIAHKHFVGVAAAAVIGEAQPKPDVVPVGDPFPLFVPVVMRELDGVSSLAGLEGGAEPRPEDQPRTRRTQQACASSNHYADGGGYTPRATRPAHILPPAGSGTTPGPTTHPAACHPKLSTYPFSQGLPFLM